MCSCDKTKLLHIKLVNENLLIFSKNDSKCINKSLEQKCRYLKPGGTRPENERLL